MGRRRPLRNGAKGRRDSAAGGAGKGAGGAQASNIVVVRRAHRMRRLHHLPGSAFDCSACVRSLARSNLSLAALQAELSHAAADQRTPTLFHLALHAYEGGLLGVAWSLVAIAAEEPLLATSLPDEPMCFLIGSIYHDTAVVDMENGDWAHAVLRLSVAAAQMSLCQENDLAIENFSEACDCFEQMDGPVAWSVSGQLLWCATMIRSCIDESIGRRLHQLLQRVSAVLLSGPQVDVQSLWLLAQAGKGMDLTLACESAGPIEMGTGLRRRLDTTRRSLPLLPPDPEVPFGAEASVLYYADSGEDEQGSDPETGWRNNQRENDRRISATLARARGPLHELIDVDSAMRALPSDSVLISMFLGTFRAAEHNDGRLRMSVSTLAMTNEAVMHHQYVVEDPEVGVFVASKDEPGPTYTVHPLAHIVEPLRRELLADPFSRPVTREAQRLLDYAVESGLPALTKWLPEWRAAGKTHLCVWPHGPLHFLPFALIGVDGRPLAQDWTVTQTVSANVLRERRSHVDASARGNLVILGAADTAGGELPNVDLNCQIGRLAKLYGVDPLTGSHAISRKALEAAGGADYLHIAAHGAHNEWAPWYQCLFLTPESGSDGRLFAYDILQADLRGVKLVTLSSCESSLGRFDVNDNLRGLPAAFLAAGAAAVVGCTWPVRPVVATDFFIALYDNLTRDPDCRAAFRAAQLRTRGLYPAYRDWGSFNFIGDWR